MTDFFYRAFEEKYRGSRELIKARLQVYLPFIQPLLSAYPTGQTLDLGCGRGEWLELLVAQGFDAQGVDLDEGMLQACRDRGMRVHKADVLDYIRTIKGESQCVISGFHIAEHLPFNVLQELVVQAERVLVPGGLLILETPNPENISVGTNSFYLDPTHQRPIPPELLSFLPDHYGFERSKVIRLQEEPNLHHTNNLELLNVLNGVSPDYAVVAQKKGSEKLLQSTDCAFGKEYGLTLGNLATRYQQLLTMKLSKVDGMEQLQMALELTKTLQAHNERLSIHIEQAKADGKEQLQTALDLARNTQAHNQRLSLLIKEAKDEIETTRHKLTAIQQSNNDYLLQLVQARKELSDLHNFNHCNSLQLEQTRKELSDLHNFNHCNLLQLEQTRKELAESDRFSQDHSALAEQRLHQINSLQNSKSWLITAPLRWVASLILLRSLTAGRSPVDTIRLKLSSIFKISSNEGSANASYLNKIPAHNKMSPIFVRAILKLKNYPVIRVKLMRILRLFPSLEFRLRHAYQYSRMHGQAPATQWKPAEKGTQAQTIEPESPIDVLPVVSLSQVKKLTDRSLGVNALQRSPLEAHFSDYGSRP